MYIFITIALLGLSGDPALGGFEGWTPPEPDISAGEVRVIGSPPARMREYYVLEEPPQLAFITSGPATVVLRIAGDEERLVNISLDLDAAAIREETVLASSKRPAEIFLQVPEGKHLVAVSASGRILLSVQSTDQAPARSDKVVVWAKREKSDSPFWKYQPDLSKFEFKEEKPPSRWSFWVNAGLGPSVDMESSTSGLGFGGSANLRFDYYLVQIRSTYNLEMSVLGPEPQESLWEVSPMFGFVLKGRVGWISACAGAGLVGGVKRGALIEQGEDSAPDKYEEDEFINIGFPLDIQLFLKPPSFLMFGLGLNIYANLGPDNSMVGLMISIMAGT